MLRILFVALALICGASLPARAAVLTLPCDGTLKAEGEGAPAKSEAITKMGVIDLDAKIVTGFAVTADFDEVNANWVSFKGTTDFPEERLSINGTIDRITGWLRATVTSFNTKTTKLVMTEKWELICKSTKPLF